MSLIYPPPSPHLAASFVARIRTGPNIKNSTVTRIVYAVLMFLLTIAAWAMMVTNSSSLIHFVFC